MKESNIMDLDGKGVNKELGWIEGTKIVIRTYYMKNYLFSIKNESSRYHKGMLLDVSIRMSYCLTFYKEPGLPEVS